MLKYSLELMFKPFKYLILHFCFVSHLNEVRFSSPLPQDQSMFQRKDSTGHECVKRVQFQDETTARVYIFLFLSSFFLVILLTVVET